MKVRFDRTVRMMYVEFAPVGSLLTVEEEAELITSPRGKLLGLRVRLSNVRRELPGSSIQAVAAPCTAAGWHLSDIEGEPSLYGELRRVRGVTSALRWEVNVDLDVEGKRIVGLEIDLGGAARFVGP